MEVQSQAVSGSCPLPPGFLWPHYRFLFLLSFWLLLGCQIQLCLDAPLSCSSSAVWPASNCLFSLIFKKFQYVSTGIFSFFFFHQSERRSERDFPTLFITFSVLERFIFSFVVSIFSAECKQTAGKERR